MFKNKLGVIKKLSELTLEDLQEYAEGMNEGATDELMIVEVSEEGNEDEKCAEFICRGYDNVNKQIHGLESEGVAHKNAGLVFIYLSQIQDNRER